MKGKMDSRISVKFLFFTGALLFSFGSWQSVCSQVKPEWKSQWGKVLSRAKEEGKVVVFGPPGDLIRKAVTTGSVIWKKTSGNPRKREGSFGSSSAGRILDGSMRRAAEKV
ncbi:MAG: hypothetical protein O7B35_10585 [Deltaproteobacteria bacterium]|nr:hypothetical protein [Deltaproteobacteria bacterium]